MSKAMLVAVCSLFLSAYAYPSGGPCGRLVPNHGGPIENDGTFELVFRPNLTDGKALLGTNYTISLGPYEKAVPRGLAVSVSQGTFDVPTKCAEVCKSPVKRHSAFVHHKKPTCPVMIIWTPAKTGEALFDYTVLKKYTEWVNIQKKVTVATEE